MKFAIFDKNIRHVRKTKYAFLECKNVARFWRSIEDWIIIRRVIDGHLKLSDVDKIFGTLPINITI